MNFYYGGKEQKDQTSFRKREEQALRDWQPLKPKNSVCIFGISAAYFTIMGIVLAVYDRKTDELRVRYDDKGGCVIGSECKLPLIVEKDIEPPIYFYYELNNYFQNHRVYLESKDNEQLKGTYKEIGELSTCSPKITNGDMTKNTSLSGKSDLISTDPATPCGLIAGTMFNDTYKLLNSNGGAIPINETDISWSYDKRRFKNTNKLDKQWISMEDEHFQVWMRPAGLNKFKKLWGRIEQTMPAGVYTIVINNKFPIDDYEGRKIVVLSTSNLFGSKNLVLYVGYLVTGIVCAIISIYFIIKYCKDRRKKLI